MQFLQVRPLCSTILTDFHSFTRRRFHNRWSLRFLFSSRQLLSQSDIRQDRRDRLFGDSLNQLTLTVRISVVGMTKTLCFLPSCFISWRRQNRLLLCKLNKLRLFALFFRLRKIDIAKFFEMFFGKFEFEVIDVWQCGQHRFSFEKIRKMKGILILFILVSPSFNFVEVVSEVIIH